MSASLSNASSLSARGTAARDKTPIPTPGLSKGARESGRAGPPVVQVASAPRSGYGSVLAKKKAAPKPTAGTAVVQRTSKPKAGVPAGNEAANGARGSVNQATAEMEAPLVVVQPASVSPVRADDGGTGSSPHSAMTASVRADPLALAMGNDAPAKGGMGGTAWGEAVEPNREEPTHTSSGYPEALAQTPVGDPNLSSNRDPPRGRALGHAAAATLHSQSALEPKISAFMRNSPTGPRGGSSAREFGRSLALAWSAAIQQGGMQEACSLLQDLDRCTAKRTQCLLAYLQGIAEECPGTSAMHLVDIWECGFSTMHQGFDEGVGGIDGDSPDGLRHPDDRTSSQDELLRGVAYQMNARASDDDGSGGRLNASAGQLAAPVFGNGSNHSGGSSYSFTKSKGSRPVYMNASDVLLVPWHEHELKREIKREKRCQCRGCNRLGTTIACTKRMCEFYMCQPCWEKFGVVRDSEQHRERRQKFLMHFVRQVNEAFKQGGRTIFGQVVSDLRSFFCALDKDNSGELDRNEISRGLRRLDISIKHSEVDDFVALLDGNRNDMIELGELIRGFNLVISWMKRGIVVRTGYTTDTPVAGQAVTGQALP